MSAIERWLYGLFSAAIGAAGGAIPLVIIAPSTFNMSGPGLWKLFEACAASALIAVGMFLKQSPLPAMQETTETTTLTKTTTSTPAPDRKGQ
jgi:Na+-driven multidrug efflux pump